MRTQLVSGRTVLGSDDRAARWVRLGGGARVLLMTAAVSIAATVAGVKAEPAPATARTAAATAVAKPGSLADLEARYMQRLDAAIAPIRNYAISPAEAVVVRDTAKAYANPNRDAAGARAASVSDPVAKKLLEWVRLRNGYGEATEYRAFLDQNPLWPERSLMSQRLEEALFTKGGSASEIKTYFKTTEPKTGIGYAALASAHLAEGDKDKARALAQRAWRQETIPTLLETGFLERFGSLLTEADHKWRLDRLIVDEIRWAGERNARVVQARRVIALLSAPEKKKANARLAVFQKSKNAKALIAAFPEDKDTDWGLAFHKAQTLRRAGNLDAAAKLLLAAPVDPDKVANLDEWWIERRQNAYEAIEDGKPKRAYELIRNAGPLSVNPLKEQTFMAGWVALRMLKDAAAAEKHFADFRKAADGPLGRAKASYWLGRTAEAQSDKAKAAQHYQDAAKDNDTFHGLLAMQKLEPGRRRIDVKPPAEPTEEQIKRFNGLDAAKAIVVARRAGLSREITRPFLINLRNQLDTEADSALVAHLADALDDVQISLRIGKSAIARGHNLITYAYPLHAFPNYTPLRPPPEKAFLLGIGRQETEFNPQTVSGAGAKGILQVMNVTAAHVCRDYKIKCDIARLLSDSSYNTMIASAYIGDRMQEFAGSYILSLAGYNAGPGRTRQWIRELGDPRDPKIDPVDWIERIPIQETREYVAKVLANIQVYRARLGDGANALRLDEDLTRARGKSDVPSAADDDQPATLETKSDG